MINSFKKNWLYFVFPVSCCTLISYGLSDILDFTKSLAISLPILSLISYRFWVKTRPDDQTQELIMNLDNIIGEQTQVIDEYEKIFDSQLVELPCVCGGNTFQGLFSPKTENIVECEKCKNKYRVNINYDSILISDPQNKTFEQIVSENL